MYKRQAHDIVVPAGVVKDPNVDPAPPMEPFEVWRDERVTVSAILVPHGLVYPNFAYRFDTASGSVVFSGDTALSPNLVKLARGADILVHEAIDPAWVDHIVGPKPWDARQPVSYTHLDVYKRQVQAKATMPKPSFSRSSVRPASVSYTHLDVYKRQPQRHAIE